MRTCSKCRLDLGQDEFAGKDPLCRSCRREYNATYYARTKERHASARAQNKEAAKQRNRAAILEYLRAHPCVDCGETDTRVLELHHVRGEKEFDIPVALSTGWALPRLMTELGKYDVLCANDRRRRVVPEGSWAWAIVALGRPRKTD